MSPEPRLLEVRKNVLKQNDVVARSICESRQSSRASRLHIFTASAKTGKGMEDYIQFLAARLSEPNRTAPL
jgi:hydrogenase nickel incorporation protein HypB